MVLRNFLKIAVTYRAMENWKNVIEESYYVIRLGTVTCLGYLFQSFILNYQIKLCELLLSTIFYTMFGLFSKIELTIFNFWLCHYQMWKIKKKNLQKEYIFSKWRFFHDSTKSTKKLLAARLLVRFGIAKFSEMNSSFSGHKVYYNLSTEY